MAPGGWTSGCSEQGKLPAANAFKLAERDKHMSEQKKSFRQQLDEWTNATVIVPMTRAVQSGDEGVYHEVAASVEKAIWQKVLDSYHNGQAAGPRAVDKGQNDRAEILAQSGE